MKNFNTIFPGFLGVLGLLALSACSGNSTRPACFECTTTPQKWSDFSFESLEGTWRGTQDYSRNESEAKNAVSKQQQVEITFLDGHKFLRAYGLTEASCPGFPNHAVVLVNELWWDRVEKRKDNQHAFEVFGRLEKDQVSYGRAYITKKHAKTGNVCEYASNEHPITMNRLALPAVALTRRMSPDGRALASQSTREVDAYFEFLHYENARVDRDYQWRGKEQAAPLFFRFIKTTREVKGPFDLGEWQATEEKVFRLWRVGDGSGA